MNIHINLLSDVLHRLRGGGAGLQHFYGPLNLVAGKGPTGIRQVRNQRAFEVLMERHGLSIIAGVVGKKSERQLCRAATAVSPFESAGTVIPQVEAGIEGAT